MSIKNTVNSVGKYWKIFSLAVVLVVLIVSIKSCNENNRKADDLQKALHYNDSMYNSKLVEWKGKAGELHTQVDNLYVDHFALLNMLDSISKVVRVPVKSIERLNSAVNSIMVDDALRVDTGSYKKIPCEGKDSVIVPVDVSFSWKDNYMLVWGSVGSFDSVHVVGIDTLSRVDYFKKKWLLGAKTYYSDFTNKNPHIKLTGYKGVQFREKEKKWNLGLAVFYGYPVNYIQLNKPVAGFGISLQYSLLKF